MKVMIPPITGLNLKQTASISSFEKNPLNGQIPAMARQATRKVICVTGMYFRSPPMVDISLECTAWMMQPAPRKSRALNMACVKRWNMEAMYPRPPSCGSADVHTPKATIMNPIWEMVLKASTLFMSLCTHATTAA